MFKWWRTPKDQVSIVSSPARQCLHASQILRPYFAPAFGLAAGVPDRHGAAGRRRAARMRPDVTEKEQVIFVDIDREPAAIYFLKEVDGGPGASLEHVRHSKSIKLDVARLAPAGAKFGGGLVVPDHGLRHDPSANDYIRLSILLRDAGARA